MADELQRHHWQGHTGQAGLAKKVSDSTLNSSACPCRTGQTVFNGTIGNATVLASGTGSVFLLGTNTSVTVDLAGVSNVWLRNTRSELLHAFCGCHCPHQNHTAAQHQE